ncbi:MAG: transcriptional regulator [Chitinophagaceae bacterium]|nr:transcriptional regulator [Chitinophagaceae bacterium]
MKKLFYLLLVFPLLSSAQNTIGLPDVINYAKKTYGAGLQTWDITQDARGIVYMANNEGLLSYDGQYWNLYPLPNRTIVRSVRVSPDNRIYTGGQDEIGFFTPASNNALEYRSLTALIPARDRSFGDVWDICIYGKAVWFRTQNRIFRYTDNTISVYTSPAEWSFLGVCGDRLYAHDFREGLLQFTGNVWAPVKQAKTLPAEPVTAILALGNDSSLVTTLKAGVFVLTSQGLQPLHSPALQIIQSERIYAATMIGKNWIALATNSNGVQIVDTKGELIQKFSRSEGLQNNNVLSIYLDRQENLWLGLDNGIDFIAYNSAIKKISPYSQEGSGYTAIIHDNLLYTGTSAGLYSVPLQSLPDLSFSKGAFSPVTNTTGQVWGLANINDQLLLGHHEGAFIVSGNTARPLYNPGKGVWNFVPSSTVYPTTMMISGTYRGLSFFNYTGDHFTEGGSVQGLDESCRFVAIDQQGTIWVSHPYHGVYKVSKDVNGKYQHHLYTAADGLPSTLNNHVYKINNEVLVATEKGVYTYDAAKDRFSPSAFYQELLGQKSIRYLCEDNEGNIWFIHEKQLAVLDRSGKKPVILRLPELDNKLLSGFEFIYPMNARNIFIGGEKGFFLVNYEKYKQTMPALQAMVRSVRIFNRRDSLLFGGYLSDSSKESSDIQHNWGSLRINYAAPVYGQQDNLEFSYRLRGLDDNWSEWTAKTEKEYTHLPAGNYHFEVKVRNHPGNESAPAIFSFRILPPWYQSVWAYLVYLLLIAIGIFYLYKWQVKKFKLQQEKYEKEQTQLQYLHQLEINKAENELVALRNEKLQAEVDFKNSELATNAMHLVQKSELMAKLRSELNHLMKALDNEKAQSEIKKMVKVLGEDEKMDNDWMQFTHHFDKVHSDFVVVLKEKYPSITANELKLSAYLRMNLSTKEIARLMNISVRGVEISRYRLRKKLGISSEMNLFDFLMSIKS